MSVMGLFGGLARIERSVWSLFFLEQTLFVNRNTLILDAVNIYLLKVAEEINQNKVTPKTVTIN